MTEPPLLCTKMCEVILCCASSPNLCLYTELTVSGSSWCLAAIPPFVSWHRPAWKSSSSASGHWCWLSATDSEACPPPQKHHCNLQAKKGDFNHHPAGLQGALWGNEVWEKTSSSSLQDCIHVKVKQSRCASSNAQKRCQYSHIQ